MAPTAVLGPGAIFRKKLKRTHLSTTDVLDDIYKPCRPVADKYRHYFQPTNLVNTHGELNEDIAEDAMATRHRRMSETVVEATPIEVQA